jgi:tetratricopeptide (TPR) repeat protein
LADPQSKDTSWSVTPTWKPSTVSATSAPPRGTNPLQDSFIQLDRAEQLRLEGKLDRAQKICETLLREHPDYMAALHTLGLIYADKKNYQRSLDHLVRAVMLNPRSWSTLTALSGVYLELGANEMAAQALEQARAIKPQDANVLVTLGEIYRQEREYELAKEAFGSALKIEPNLVPAASGFGWICLYLGHNAEAVETFEGLVKRGVCTFEILAALAQVPSSLITVDLVAETEKLSREFDGKDPHLNNSLRFVHAIGLDKAGRYREAWETFVPANRAAFASLQKEHHDSVQRELAIVSRLRGNSVKAALDDGQFPISLFILGPSRSGKTSMEALVATIDGVKRGYENPIVDNAIRRTFQTAGLLTSAFFEMLPPQLYESCREIYLEELARRATPAKVFTNTHPARILDAALIANVFPNVRFICVKRKLEDVVLRMYQRRYREANAYSYDLKAARDHVLWYHEMMDLFAQKLPERARVIQYEDLVTNPAGALRIAAELCGLATPEHTKMIVGDDRGCAAPYREFMAAALQT